MKEPATQDGLCVPSFQSAKLQGLSANLQRGFSWDDVRVFLALFRTRTLSSAAVRLGVNPSTVGRRLEALEGALGARLFDRTPDGFVPTNATERLFAHAQRLEEAAYAMGGAVEEFEKRAEGVVRITAPPGVAEHFFAPALPLLLSRYPALRIELHASLRNLDLRRREADLALRGVRPQGGDLVTVKIADEQDGLFTSAAYAAELGAVRELGEARWIGWERDMEQVPSARWLNDRVPESNVVLRTSSIVAQVTAAEAGVGVVLLPASYGKRRALSAVRLSAGLRASLPPTPRQSLWLVSHRATRAVPRVAAVWETIVEMRGIRVRRGSRGGR
jgi:DNA-binding transcriptional LysR family regulator